MSLMEGGLVDNEKLLKEERRWGCRRPSFPNASDALEDTQGLFTSECGMRGQDHP